MSNFVTVGYSKLDLAALTPSELRDLEHRLHTRGAAYFRDHDFRAWAEKETTADCVAEELATRLVRR